jgi:hypothetical protein
MPALDVRVANEEDAIGIIGHYAADAEQHRTRKSSRQHRCAMRESHREAGSRPVSHGIS